WVRLKITFGVVDGDRPEAVDRHVLDVELVDCRAIVLCGRRGEIERVFLWIAAPAHGGADQMPHRIVSVKVVLRTSKASRTFFWLAGSQFGSSSSPGSF